MRAVLRGKILLSGTLLFVPAVAVAQSAPVAAASDPPAADTVGPQELQNFSLSGSVSKPADQQSQAPPTTSAAPAGVRLDNNDSPIRPRSSEQFKRDQQPAHIAAVEQPSVHARIPEAKAPDARIASTQEAAPSMSAVSGTATRPSLPTSSFSSAAMPATAGSLAAEHRLMIWPWLVAALVVAGATLFLLWRRRNHEAFAAGPQRDRFVSPSPVPPAPRPQAAPPRAAEPKAAPAAEPRGVAEARPPTPASKGIVSTRLRPVIEVGVQPMRCLVDDARVVVEFELELFNSGTAPARAVLAEASLFNAGANQEEELAAFFATPLGAGERLDVIPPMKRISFINKVTAPLTAIQEYELGGRKVFVPILAFNALYTWSGGEAQTSAAYLVGRDTAGDKLAPLSLEGAPRQIAGLAGRSLPTARRT